jgi:multimeric flavodoxin WrbA
MKVIAINGSARLDGNTSILIKTALGELEKEGIATELVQLGPKPLQGCIACYKCFERKNKRCSVENDALNDLVEKMISAQGIILGSPVYWGDVTSNMKSLIDRSGMVARANGDLFQGKAGAAVAAVRRAGAVRTMDTINHLFLAHRMYLVGSSYWNLGLGRDKGEVEQDKEGLRTMTVLGQNMARLLKKLF